MFNKDLGSQIGYLEEILTKSQVTNKVLELAPKLEMPDWYLGAGAVAQTVWNELHGFPLEQGIRDCDLVYFDTDTSAEAQDRYTRKASELFAGLPTEVEVVNEARVHIWYEEELGKEIRPYKSSEDAINTWPTTATSVGVRYDKDKFMIYAPYGLNDLFGMIVRPNKTLLTYKVYEEKVERWRKAWPKLTVIPWDE
jgi:hypothetical protein